MAAIFSFTCACCDKICEGSPSFAFARPDHWLEQSAAVRAAGFASDDQCWYEDEDGVHYFIRTILEVPILGIAQPFLWGVWVSLSKTSYKRYDATYFAPELDDQWFAYLCNRVPGYDRTLSLKATVRPRPGKQRPVIALHEAAHQLAVDFRDGISVARAQALAQALQRH
jgi:hypothetical protein